MSAAGRHTWSRIPPPGQDSRDDPTPPSIYVTGEFERLVSTILAPGATGILTPDSLSPPADDNPRLIESEPPATMIAPQGNRNSAGIYSQIDR